MWLGHHAGGQKVIAEPESRQVSGPKVHEPLDRTGGRDNVRPYLRPPENTLSWDLDGPRMQGIVGTLREQAETSDDRAEAALADAIERYAMRWRRRRRRREELQALLEAAAEAEQVTVAELAAVLSTVIDLVHPPGSRPATPVPTEPAGNQRVQQRVQVCLLGPVEFRVDDRIIEQWAGPKTLRVLCFLLSRRSRATTRDLLIDTFWPDVDANAGRRSLHQCIYSIRERFRAVNRAMSFVIFEHDSYTIDPALDLWYDVDEYSATARLGLSAEQRGDMADANRHYVEAIELYRGDFVEEFPYDDWAMAQRDLLRAQLVTLYDRLGALRFQQDDIDGALNVAQQALIHDSCDEVAHRLAMSCHARSGHLEWVARQYQRCTDTLRRDLDAPPSTETTCLFESLVKGGAHRIRATGATLEPSSTVHH
jgi:DNA-binding SARP family transcriptional activator